MSREFRYTLEVESPRHLTKQQAQELDRQNPNRRRLSAGALDDLNAMRAITVWADSILKNKNNESLMREMGVWQRMKAGLGLLASASLSMMQQTSAVQLRTLDANWLRMNITLSSTGIVPGFVNLDIGAVETLINQALVACREGFCLCGERESLGCPVRQALDNCINAGRAIERTQAADGLDHCPYALNTAQSRAV